MSAAPAYRCEAVNGCDESTVRPYLVTDHDGDTEVAHYCAECFEFALSDWNGETASVREVS